LLGKDQSTVNCLSVRLLEVAYLCQGFSGRVLRKLPFLGTSPTTVVIATVVLEDLSQPLVLLLQSPRAVREGETHLGGRVRKRAEARSRKDTHTDSPDAEPVIDHCSSHHVRWSNGQSAALRTPPVTLCWLSSSAMVPVRRSWLTTR
jgi:hypothetical protein